MFCSKCGHSLSEQDKFCPECGTAVAAEAVPQATPLPSEANPLPQNPFPFVNTPSYSLRSPMMIATLVVGIISICLSALNYMGIPYVHLGGIVLGIIAISLASKDKRDVGFYSKGGLVTGILGLSLGVLAIIIGILLASAV